MPKLAPLPARVAAASNFPHISDPNSAWTGARLAVEQMLWGDGFLSPGGDADLVRYTLPLSLSTATTVLLLGVATGGPPAMLARDLGSWVMAHEADPVLLAVSAARIAGQGGVVAKRVAIAGLDRAAPAFRPKFCNHAVLLESLHDLALQPTIAAVAAALKPGAQIVILELVDDFGLAVSDPAVAAWMRLEGRSGAPFSAAAITDGLVRLNFDVRIEEDISLRHIGQALLGWNTLVLAMAESRPAPELATAVVLEAERWMRRLHLMQTGQLRLVRWHAFGK